MDMLKELMEQGKSFCLVDGATNPCGTIMELLDTLTYEPLPKYVPNTGAKVSLLWWQVEEITDLNLKDACCAFIHKNLWKEKGQWEKGKPKTVWHKKPIPVRILDAPAPHSGNRLLHTFKDGETIWYVYETTDNTRPKYWLMYP